MCTRCIYITVSYIAFVISVKMLGHIFMLISNIFVIYGSHITVERQPDTLTTINLTDPLILRCFMEGNTGVNIEWNWNEANAHDPEYYFKFVSDIREIATGVFESSSILSWKDDLEEESKKSARGTLVASATDDGHTVSCNDATLEIQWAPTTATLTAPGLLTIIKGEELTLSCSSPDKGSPTGTVEWTKDTSIQTQYTNDVLTIDSVETIDGGMWKCSYKNEHGRSTDSSNVNIDVLYPALGVTLTLSNPSPFEKGDSLGMTCAYSDPGNPVANLLFKMNGIALANLEQLNSNTYRIKSISSEHNGSLKCCYSNSADEACSEAQLLVVQSRPGKPQILTLSQTTLLIGETLSFKCSLETHKGFPEASAVFWTLNGRIVETSGNASLKIRNISEEHLGEWACNYTNTVGNGPSSDVVKVSLGRLASKANLTSTSVAGVVVLNTSLTLICTTLDKGNPPSLVKWRKDFYDYEYNEEILTIDNVEHNDSGIWDCFFQNKFGSGTLDRNYITVVWDVSTDGAINIDATNQDVREGDDVILEYELTDKGSPEAIVTWTHNDTVKSEEKSYTLKLEDVTFSDSGQYTCYANNSFSKSNDAVYTLIVKPRQEMQVWVYIVIGVCCGIIIIVIIVIIICVVKKKKRKDNKSDSIGYTNRSLQPDNMTGTGPANKPNVEAAAPVYAAVSRGKVLAPIAAGADGSVYSHVDLSKKTARQSLKGLPMSKKAIDRIIFHKKDGYVNITFQVRKKFIGDIEIGVCRIGDQSCTSKVSKQHDGASKDVVMVLPIEDRSPDSYSIRITFTERGQVTQTVDLTYPYNKNAVNVTVLNDAHGTNVSPSYADVEVEGVPPHPPRQGYPAEGVTYAVMDWDRSQAPGRPPRLSARSQAQEHVVYADVRPGGNVY